MDDGCSSLDGHVVGVLLGLDGRFGRDGRYGQAGRKGRDVAMTADEQRIHDAAIAYARANKKSRCAQLTDPSIFLPE
jgi:hypothetical protein